MKAIVALKADHELSAEALISFLKSRLSPIEIPKLVEFRTDLPKTAVGKIYKKALIDEEAAARQQDGTTDGLDKNPDNKPDPSKEKTS